MNAQLTLVSTRQYSPPFSHVPTSATPNPALKNRSSGTAQARARPPPQTQQKTHPCRIMQPFGIVDFGKLATKLVGKHNTAIRWPPSPARRNTRDSGWTSRRVRGDETSSGNNRKAGANKAATDGDITIQTHNVRDDQQMRLEYTTPARAGTSHLAARSQARHAQLTGAWGQPPWAVVA